LRDAGSMQWGCSVCGKANEPRRHDEHEADKSRRIARRAANFLLRALRVFVVDLALLQIAPPVKPLPPQASYDAPKIQADDNYII